MMSQKDVVKVGGVDVREYDLEDTAKPGMPWYLQKNVLFSGTIEENLRWGDKNATPMKKLAHACKLAQADEFVHEFPGWIQYTRSNRAVTNVSGGQKQRLCIARALIKEA